MWTFCNSGHRSWTLLNSKYKLHSEPVTIHLQSQDGSAEETYWVRENLLEEGNYFNHENKMVKNTGSGVR